MSFRVIEPQRRRFLRSAFTFFYGYADPLRFRWDAQAEQVPHFFDSGMRGPWDNPSLPGPALAIVR